MMVLALLPATARGKKESIRIRGDLLQAGLGLAAGEYDLMCEKLDSICHAGANVNWIVPYRALRQANVIGTRELIRLACKGQPKRFINGHHTRTHGLSRTSTTQPTPRGSTPLGFSF